MNTPTARPNHRRRERAHALPRFPAPRPVVSAPPPATMIITAAHDFLVPNPRPDLTTDPATLGMIAVW